jgi:hypothetical protein
MENDRYVYDRLVQVANEGKRVTYPELAGSIGLNVEYPLDRQCIFRTLNEISCAESLAGRPLISAVVVHPNIGYPEMGFFLLARELGLNLFCDERSFYYHELNKVYEFWKTGFAITKKELNKRIRKYEIMEIVV